MDPFIDLGFFSVRTYTACIIGAVFFGLAVLFYIGYRQKQPLVWLDVGVLGVVGGVFGGRLLHVLFTWAYFQDHISEAFSLRAGGMNWHGALYGGLIGVALACRWRDVPFAKVTDVLAWLFPMGAVAVWAGCRASSCAYGAEVWTLADYPAWAVSEQADIYGLVAPRYNVQVFGMWVSAGLFVLMTLLSVGGRLRGSRLWLVLILTAVGQFVLGFYRGDGAAISRVPSLSWDQGLDLSVIGFCVAAAGMMALRRRQHQVRDV